MATDAEIPDSTGPDQYPAMRRASRGLLISALAFLLLYYQFSVPQMVLTSMPPLVGLTLVGFFLGIAAPKRLFLVCFFTWWLVVMAVVLRRASLASVPLASQLFDGALITYPGWAVWLGQVYRLAAYFFAVWFGGRVGRRVRVGKTAE